MSVTSQKDNKIREEEIYFNFINSIKSDATKWLYEYSIKLFMKFCNVTNYYNLSVIEDPQGKIIKFLLSLREKGLATNSLSARLNAIYHFYDMNDITLNKKKIKMFKGEQKRNYSNGVFVSPLSVFIPPRSFESLVLLGPTSLIVSAIA